MSENTMIQPNLWGMEVAQSLEILSNVPAARSAWVNEDGIANGEFEEQINILFDDFQFKYFADESTLLFSADERLRIKKLEMHLSEFLAEMPNVVSDFGFLERDHWKSIAQKAGQIAVLIRGKLES